LASTSELPGGNYYLLTPRTSTPDAAQYHFENGTQGWSNAGEPIVILDTLTAEAYAGSRSLAVQFTDGGFASIAVSNPPVTAGSTVVYHVFIPADATFDWIQPFALEGEAGGWRWSGNWQPINALERDAWNTLTVQIPGDASSLWSLGVEFYASQPYQGVVYIDSVSY
ncbi:MAG TPA: hypothetical protein VK629_03630, partial [Steroidobacteraceae bacterium]|nr:hypothetical protein [Steroidobacteraceae bacterium]